MLTKDILRLNSNEGGAIPPVRLFPVVCSWCQAKGRRTVSNWTTVPNSHGICAECYEEVRRGIIADAN